MGNKNLTPKVQCANCDASFTRYRKSASGLYYCRQPDCQSARRKAWHAERVSGKVSVAESQVQILKDTSARFVTDALRHAHATCPDCGATNVPNGWVHFNQEGNGCGGLGIYNGAPHYELVMAVWPIEVRKYVS